jgi:hypothetical protein
LQRNFQTGSEGIKGALIGMLLGILAELVAGLIVLVCA